MNQPRVFISCGEPSGDLQAAELLRNLKQLCPGCGCSAVAGPGLLAQGAARLHGIEELSIMGGTEVLSALPRVFRILKDIRRHLARQRPDAVILVDAPEFNFRVAKIAYKLGIPAYCYISPKIWAWRTGRVHFLKKYARKIISILPFEVDFYARFGMKIDYVGNPLLDIINLPALADVPTAGGRIGIMPGSRTKEYASLLPVFAETARRLKQSRPDLSFVCLRAPNVPAERLRSLWPQDLPLALIEPEERYRAVKSCAFMLAASGTAVLECALIGTPAIVAYRVSALSYALAKKVLKIPWVSLPNLILNREIFPELLQDKANAGDLAALGDTWLSDPEILPRLRQDLAVLRSLLGPPGAAHRAARLILDDLKPA